MSAAVQLVPGPSQARTDFGVGASDAAAAIGLSEYRRPIESWLVHTGQAEGFAGNDKTRWGQALEPVIRAHYVETNGLTVYVPPVSLFHRELPFVRATPDGIVLDRDDRWAFVGPQVKNVGLRMAPKWTGEDGERVAPIDYYIQGVVEMAVCDLPLIEFAVLIGGQEYFEVQIERDRGGVEADVLEQLAAYWRLVETKTRPELDDSEAFRGHLLKSIKRKVAIKATVDDVSTLERWRDVVVQMRRLKDEERGIKNRVASVLAAADANKLDAGELGAIVVNGPRKSVGWKAVAESMAPLCSTVDLAERELAGLLSLVGRDGDVAQKIESLRAQLKLARSLTDYRTLVAANTSFGDPVINRPRGWTAHLGNPDADNEE